MSKESILSRFSRRLEKKLLSAFLVLAFLLGLGIWGATRLKVNTNQIELLPQELHAVQEAHKVSDMVGGIGFLMLALKSENTEHMKRVAEDLSARIKALPEVRDVRHKLDISWVRKRIALYIKTKDLEEVRKRIKAKVKDVVRRANPFHIQLRENKPVKLDLSDIIEKYKHVGKKGIADDYNITPDKKMLLLLIKPVHASTDLDNTRKLLVKIEALIAAYNKDNIRKASLKEGYRGLHKDATITYGYSGGYKLNLDDSDSIIQSLIPTSIVSISGILILLLVFLRRVLLVFSLMFSLLSGVVLTFGFCYLSIGELNSITAILAGILMGQGIDFGIQFIYRAREEYTKLRELTPAIGEAMTNLGPAAITTACSTAAAFFALTISDFRGFRDFGLVAGGGTFLIAACMFFVTAMQLLLLGKLRPQYLDRILLVPPLRAAGAGRAEGDLESPAGNEKEKTKERMSSFPAVRPIIWGGLVLTMVLLVSATGGTVAIRTHAPSWLTQGVKFDYDSRALTVKDRPSIILKNEIKERYEISADPAGIRTTTLQETKALFDKLYPLDPVKHSTIDAVISLFLFLPPRKQQEANVKVLAQLKKDLSPIKPSMLDPELRKHYHEFMSYLDAKPFTLKDIPEFYKRQFRNVPDSKTKGYITFIYPKIALWDSRDLLAFSNQIAEIEAAGKTYYATGLALIFARLAEIVLRDGKYFTLLAALAILIILLVALRNILATAVALLPLVIGVICMLGMMAFFGQRINFMNIVVFPVILGYGMGNGIYIFHRYRESGSVIVAVRQTGRAVLASCITTLVGWSSLLTANHLGLESMGMLSSLGIGCVLVTSLVVLPAVLQVVGSRTNPWGRPMTTNKKKAA